MATHREVANNWFKQTGRKCNGFNMYYAGETIYSYGPHFPIARHVTDSHGKPCILFTTDSCSVSTSKHIGHVWSAMDYGRGVRVFNIPDVGSDYLPAMDHEGNLFSYDKRIDAVLSLWCKARSEWKKNWAMGAMEDLENEQAEYALAFGLEFDDKRRRRRCWPTGSSNSNFETFCRFRFENFTVEKGGRGKGPYAGASSLLSRV